MPNLVGAYSPLTRDPVMANRPMAQRGIYSPSAVVVVDDCDWFDPTTPGADFFDPTTPGADFFDTQSSVGWHGTQVGQKWKSDKDCE